jgi:hypothetical protein
MAVSNTLLAVRFVGNNATNIAYPITFPFLDESHIYAARVERAGMGTLSGSGAPDDGFTDWQIDLTFGQPIPQLGEIVEDARRERARISNVVYLGSGIYQVRTSNAEAFAPLESETIFRPTNTLLSAADYTVVRNADGTGGELFTKAPIPATSQVIVFRSIPLTQPTVFQPAGPFPAKSNETALDRLLMQVQQLNRRINDLAGINELDYVEAPSNDPNAAHDVATWATPAARGGVKPSWAGQLGVERSTGTVWIAHSTNTGDWQEFRPLRTNRLVIGVTADAGDPGSKQNAIANLFDSWECDAVLFGGDNNYNLAAGYHADWAAFAPLISASKAFPALGNHDLDSANWQALLDAKFPYLPGNRRYYSVALGNGLVEVFVLNSGLNTDGDIVEPDGIDVGSVQHDWFVSKLEASKARWKIAMFHHPPATLVSGDDRTTADLVWPELARMDLIICGHTHAMEILKWRDTMLVNPSASVQPPRPIEAVLQGAETLTAYPLWANDEAQGACRIVASQERLEVEIWRADGALLHSRSFDDFSARPCLQEQYRVLNAGTVVGALDHRYVGTLGAPSMIRRVMIAVAEAPTDLLQWTLYAGNVVVATGSMGEEQTHQMAASQVATDMIPRGTQLTISTGDPYGSPPSDATGLDVSVFLQRYH